MKLKQHLLKFISLLFVLLIIVSCKKGNHKSIKEVRQNYSIPIEGSCRFMAIDRKSSVNELVSRLTTNNELYDTGKGYWIGYNDLMFSIAIHSDSAINPLLNFIDTTKCLKAKFAAVYTLHLIGIDCKIKGRTHEDFVNQKARNALFRILAQNDSLRTCAMELIIRDPRESDIPHLFNILDSSKTDCWQITSGLLRYNLKDRPVAQEIPESYLDYSITLKKKVMLPESNDLSAFMRAFSRKYSHKIDAEKILFNYKYQTHIQIFLYSNRVSLGYLTHLCTMTNFCNIGYNFQYRFQDGKIKFLSEKTTKSLWLKWWMMQHQSFKDSLSHSYKKMEMKRY